jgi:hypothetical protein
MKPSRLVRILELDLTIALMEIESHFEKKN